MSPEEHDAVNHPKHYTSHPSGVECIQITEHMNFCLGNAMKYIWRAGLKSAALEDLEKARWYLDREIKLRRGQAIPPSPTYKPPTQPVGVAWAEPFPGAADANPPVESPFRTTQENSR